MATNAECLLPSEESILAARKSIFEFMGWRFGDDRGCGQAVLVCYKPLLNPFPKNAFWSYATYTVLDDISLVTAKYAPELERFLLDEKKARAAWLIAHWYEHALMICPCQDDAERVGEDERPSNFRKAVVNALMWYDRYLSEPVHEGIQLFPIRQYFHDTRTGDIYRYR